MKIPAGMGELLHKFSQHYGFSGGDEANRYNVINDAYRIYKGDSRADIIGDTISYLTSASDDKKDKHASPDLSSLVGTMKPPHLQAKGPVDVSAQPFPRFPELKEPSLAPLAESVRGDIAPGHSNEISSQANLDQLLTAFRDDIAPGHSNEISSEANLDQLLSAFHKGE
ncbi:hypothetical protein LMG33818_002209 [Halomonadaceae bacterium LMG 33818]|uniref:hypothetical protein n=1 Tax=Cernens ardua TaxID=3402176 RepID=UPI003EDC9524